jgi:excisionase family DNA binding protein
MPAKPDPLLTVDQAAELLGTSASFARRLIAERKIRFVHVGRCVRFPESALAEFIAAGTVQPVTACETRDGQIGDNENRPARSRDPHELRK